MEAIGSHLVSIITSTNKPHLLKNIFHNFDRQQWKNKELIIILNKDEIDIKEWRKRAGNCTNVLIFQLPEVLSLGECYNFAIEKTKGECIATFDDDDYYGSYYISSLMKVFGEIEADIIGKGAYYTYVESQQALVIRHPKRENRYVKSLYGGKRLVKREVFQHVRFRPISIEEDIWFCRDCLEKGFKIYSADKYHHVYVRSANSIDNTYKVRNDAKFLSKCCKLIGNMEDYISYVDRLSEQNWQEKR